MFVLDAAPHVAAQISTTAVPARPAPHPAAGNPITVTRWRRFRHDRAYVQVHGEHVGYRDLVTGEIRAFDLDDVELIARVTAVVQHDADARRAG